MLGDPQRDLADESTPAGADAKAVMDTYELRTDVLPEDDFVMEYLRFRALTISVLDKEALAAPRT